MKIAKIAYVEVSGKVGVKPTVNARKIAQAKRRIADGEVHRFVSVAVVSGGELQLVIGFCRADRLLGLDENRLTVEIKCMIQNAGHQWMVEPEMIRVGEVAGGKIAYPINRETPHWSEEIGEIVRDCLVAE